VRKRNLVPHFLIPHSRSLGNPFSPNRLGFRFSYEIASLYLNPTGYPLNTLIISKNLATYSRNLGLELAIDLFISVFSFSLRATLFRT
jgi:hypothetical protein